MKTFLIFLLGMLFGYLITGKEVEVVIKREAALIKQLENCRDDKHDAYDKIIYLRRRLNGKVH